MRYLGASVELAEIGEETLSDGSKIPLPPLVFARLGADPKKKTVLIYGHLDVQPAALSDGWDTEPFKLIEKDGKLYGRGSTDDKVAQNSPFYYYSLPNTIKIEFKWLKGPVLAWINVIEAYNELKQEIPINIKVRLFLNEFSNSYSDFLIYWH